MVESEKLKRKTERLKALLQEGDPKVILQREQTQPENALAGFVCS